MKNKIIEILNKSVNVSYAIEQNVILEQDFEKLAEEIEKLFSLPVVSGSLPTSEELQEIVVKIAYSQQGEEQSDDCYAKMGMLHEFISKYVNGNDR